MMKITWSDTVRGLCIHVAGIILWAQYYMSSFCEILITKLLYRGPLQSKTTGFL